MAKFYDELNADLRTFIAEQQLFFVASAPTNGGHINLSPKGLDSLRILSDQHVAWLNLTGSGNETAAHVIENGRMTIMFCSFTKQPLILRLYGKARVVHPRDSEWQAQYSRFPSNPGARQIYILQIDSVQTSCGFSVPFYEFQSDRNTLTQWAEKRGDEGIRQYWEERNQTSLDGLPTDILEADNK